MYSDTYFIDCGKLIPVKEKWFYLMIMMMCKKLRLLIFKLIKALLLIILVIVASFKYFEMRYFKPYLPYIEEMYNQAKREESVTEMVKEVIFCLETETFDYFDYYESSPYSYIAGVVAIHLVERFVEYKKASEWHFYNVLWTILLIHHFDKEKLFILYLHLIRFERGFGLANSAQYYFKKKISQLTVEEVVMLLGIARSPTMYSPFSHPENAKKIQSRLMQKLKESNCFPLVATE